MPLDPPPLDESGQTLPHDHHGILAGDGVIRRVSIHHLVTDEKYPGKKRISGSMAFRPSTGENGGMSVDLESLIVEAGVDARAFVASPEWVGAVRFTAGAVRAEGFMVGYDPMPNNPYHGQVWGRFSKQVQKRLAALAEPFVPVPYL